MPNTSPDFDFAQFADYLSGAMPDANARAFEAWVAQDEARASMLAGLRQKWEMPHSNRSEPDRNAAWTRIASEITQTSQGSNQIKAGPRRIARTRDPRFKSPLLWGGMLAVAAIGIFVFPQIQKQMERGQEPQEYVAQRGQQLEVPLADGSRVILAPDTRITYQVTGSTRHVTLEGQAYFSVTADAKRPFVVQAGTVRTDVLGTSFVVRSYITDEAPQVAVAEGKVAVNAGKEAQILMAGDVGIAAPDGSVSITRHIAIGDVFGWMRGQLAFGDVPFATAAQDVERKYDIEIDFADTAVANRHVTAVFSEESVTEMLNLLALTVDATYRRDGRRVVFASR